MASTSTLKSLEPDLRARVQREATTQAISDIARYLQEQLGQKITSYLSGVDHAKTVGLWVSGQAEPRDLPKTRLRCAYQAARLLVGAYDAGTARAWFFGSNTLLDDEAPAYLLRHGTTPDDFRLIIPAARNFVESAVPALAEVP
jgi:hypothetical protein